MPFCIIAKNPDTPPEKLVERAFRIIEQLEPNQNYNYEVLGRFDELGRYRLEIFPLFPCMSYKYKSNIRRSFTEPLIKQRSKPQHAKAI